MENICICSDPFSNHVTALISPNRRALTELAVKLAKPNIPFEQLCLDPDIHEHVFKSIQTLCTELGFKLREVPVAITMVKEEWSQDNNLLTAAFKMKRKQVNDFYRDQIKQMFEQV